MALYKVNLKLNHMKSNNKQQMEATSKSLKTIGNGKKENAPDITSKSISISINLKFFKYEYIKESRPVNW